MTENGELTVAEVIERLSALPAGAPVYYGGCAEPLDDDIEFTDGRVVFW